MIFNCSFFFLAILSQATAAPWTHGSRTRGFTQQSNTVAAPSSTATAIASSTSSVSGTVAPTSTQVSTSSTSSSPTTSTGTQESTPATSASSNTSSQPSKKKGMGWDQGRAGGNVPANLASALGWYYNWGAAPSSGFGSAVFAPQLWGSDATTWEANVVNGQTPAYAMGFNEPDGSGQANMATASAAASWNKDIGPLKAKGATLISPATAAATGNSLFSLSAFSKAITVQWDITAYHCYTHSASDFEAQVTAAYKAFNKPVWVTEFACLSWDSNGNPLPCSDSDSVAFMKSTVAWMEEQSFVTGYAWEGFQTSGTGTSNALVVNGAITSLGTTYAGL